MSSLYANAWCVVMDEYDNVRYTLVLDGPNDWWVINGAWSMPKDKFIDDITKSNTLHRVMLNETDCILMDALRQSHSWQDIMYYSKKLALQYNISPMNDVSIKLGDL